MAVTIKRNKPLQPWESTNDTPYIEIQSVSKAFNHDEALSRVSLSIYEGEFFSLLGPSGCGKTTLLRLLAGFETPTSGKIFIDGVDVTHIPPYKRPVNMMFQSYALFPHMTVYENIAFGLQFDDTLTQTQIHDRVYEVLDLVQMKHFVHRKPHELSGGQKQRVALARSLAKHPKLILLDEPLGALDRNLREATQFELVDIQERVGITFIMVTHDQEEAMTMSSRIAIMQEGEIAQVGSPHEIYEFPHSRYVADFIGTVNMFSGIVTGQAEEYILIDSNDIGCKLQVTCTATVPIGSHVSIAIRPEKIAITKRATDDETAFNATKGSVQDIAYLGVMSIYHIKLETGKIMQVSLPNLYRLSERDVTWEDEVYVSWRPENGVVLTN